MIPCKHFSEKYTPNGCGPKGKGWKSKVFKLIPDFVFEDSCNCHDYAYDFGGCKAVDDSARYNADREFYIQMKSNIKRRSLIRRPFLYLMAFAYFKAVREHGQEFFNWFDTEHAWRTHAVRSGYMEEI